MKFLVSATGLLAMGVAAPAMATNILVNGGFEAAPVGVPFIGNSYAPNGMVQQYPGPAVTSQYLFGWNIQTPGESNLQSAPYNYSAYPSAAYEGGKYFSLNWSPLGNIVLDNTITQSFTLASASALQFSAAMATESGYTGSTLQVTIRNASNAIVAQSGLFTNTAGNAAWSLKSWDFDLAAGSYTIALRGIGSGNAWDVLLDDVRLNATAAPVPEPASWLMLITGFLATGTALRRQRRATATA